MEPQQDTEIHPPPDMTIDTAQQELGDLGFEVTVDDGSMVADLTCGRHSAAVTITPGHVGQLVTQWFSETPDGPRKMTGQNRPSSVAATVEYAREVAAALALSHAADERQAQAAMVPAIFYEQIAAKYAGKHRVDQEDPGIDFPGLEEACYGAAEPAQDGAEAATCPRCDSPDPAKHPAMQFEGEVQPCPHPWHRGNAAEPAQDGAEPDSAVTS